jgi:hypothetical protein
LHGFVGRWLVLCQLAMLPSRVWAEEPTSQPLAPDEVAGEAQAQVVGGNLVSARRRALELARRDAVGAAVAAMVSPEQLATHEAALRGGVYRRHASYIRRYRVLEEAQEGAAFRIRVAAVVNIKRLQSDVSRLLGTKPTVAPSGRPRIGVRMQVTVPPDGEPLGGALGRRVQEKLTAAGFPVADESTPSQVVVAVRVLAEDAEGVRGLGLAGGKAQASVKATLESGAVLAQKEVTTWGTGKTEKAARRVAAERAVDELADVVEEALSQRWPRGAASGGRMVRVSGVVSLRQHLALQRYLARAVPGVRRVAPWRFAAKEVWLMVQGGVKLQELSRLLVSQVFQPPSSGQQTAEADQFRLKLKSLDGGIAWLTVVKP